MRLQLLFLFFCFTSNAQSLTFKGQILNEISHKPIPYSSITNSTLNKVIDADEEGRFEIQAFIEDTIVITCIGFESKYFQLKNIDKKVEIYLKEKVIELPAVAITGREKMLVGVTEKKLDRSYIGDLETEQYEIVTMMKIPSTVTKYKISKVIIRQKEFDVRRPIRLHIYSVDSNGLPKNELLASQIILAQGMHKGNLNEIDLLNQQIIQEDTCFFVGVQWLTTLNNPKNIYNDIGISETFRSKDVLTYRRGPNFDKKWYAEFEHAMVVPSDGAVPEKVYEFSAGKAKGNPINMLASAEIQILEKK